MNSCLYEGWVRHRRFTPVVHTFRYRMFQVCLDLSELDTVFSGRWFWSTNSFSVAWFRRDDHVGDPSIPLDEAIRSEVARATGVRPGGPIRLLTHLRYFGYVMNPVSFYYCYDKAGRRVEFVVAGVHNTPRGERHCYTLAVYPGQGRAVSSRFDFRKGFHVSPFMGMNQDYRWTLSRPGQALAVHMESSQRGVLVFDATLCMERLPISRRSLARVLLSYPIMTLQVVTGIYWQALRLLFKRCPFHPHPKHAARAGFEPP